jgi:hypothetical protein
MVAQRVGEGVVTATATIPVCEKTVDQAPYSSISSLVFPLPHCR